MFQKLSKKLRKKQGFTLIELIVVLAILGIILAIAVPNYLGVQDRAAQNADENQLDLVEKAVKFWYADDDASSTGSFTIAYGVTATLTEVSPGSSTHVIDDYLEPVASPASSEHSGKALSVVVTSTDVTASYVAP